jgi:hypothetical protein
MGVSSLIEVVSFGMAGSCPSYWCLLVSSGYLTLSNEAKVHCFTLLSWAELCKLYNITDAFVPSLLQSQEFVISLNLKSITGSAAQKDFLCTR